MIADGVQWNGALSPPFAAASYSSCIACSTGRIQSSNLQ